MVGSVHIMNTRTTFSCTDILNALLKTAWNRSKGEVALHIQERETIQVRHTRKTWFKGHREETGGEGGMVEAIDKTQQNKTQ